MDLLIDNCTLLQLVYTEGYSQQLIDLENYVNDGNITLLTHPLILAEWEKNKPDDRSRKATKLLKQQNHITDQTGLLPSPIPIIQGHLDTQYAQLDKLLKKAKLIHTYEAIKNDFADRFRLRQAPFHHKLDSQNDWEIIGSAAHYCEINGIQNLYFASSNHTDFADPANRDRSIHPDIQTRFPKVDIVYFREISDFLNNLKQAILPDKFLTYNILKNEKFTHKASIRKNDLDSLYNLFKNIYEEVAFIPPHILRKYHPFSNPTGSYTNFSLFSMYNCRDSLYEMFIQIEINENGFKFVNEAYFAPIKDYQNKLEFVLLALTNNLVFNIGSEKGNKKVNIHFTKGGHCDCSRCSFLRFEFHKSLPQLKDREANSFDQLKQAYINYQFGNYSSAAKQFLQLKESAFTDKKYIIYYICLYNIRHIGRLLGNPFYGSDLSDQQIKSMTEIDPLEECVKMKSRTDYDLLSFIADSEFFRETLETISDLVAKIEDHYYAHLRGSWSSNSHVWKLTEEYAVLESFLNKNFIIYDAYSNYERLMELVIKGLFASHAMRGTDNSHMEVFDDYWINQFVSYGNKAALFKYYNRFNLKGLDYQAESRKEGSFLHIAGNLLNHEKAMKKAFKSATDKGNSYFYNYYNKLVDNLFALATLLNLSQKDVNAFGKILLKFIKSETSLNHNSFDTIASFISSKGKLFVGSLLTQYLEYFLLNYEKYDPPIIEAIVKCYPDNGLESLNTGQVVQYTLSGPDASKRFASLDFLMLLHRKSAQDGKNLIKESITSTLKKKFDFSLFYYALINDVTAINKNQLFKLLDEIDIGKQEHNFKSIFSGTENKYIRRLDDLLNVCFKFNINTNVERFNRFRQIGEYYDWLLNMDGFDYSKFDFEWVMRYRTKFYYRAMSKSKKLKEVLIGHLRTNSHPVLENILLKILHYTR